MSNVAKGQLHGWKEIAAHLGRDERTAKRWEKQRGLPVRRIPGSGRANVYVLVSELEAWLSAGSQPALTPSTEAQAVDLDQPLQPIHAQAWTSPANDQSLASESNWSASVHSGLRANLQALALILLLVGAVGGTTLVAHRFGGTHPVPIPQSASAGLLKTQADQQYLQSLYFLEQRTPDSLQEAKRNLLEVIAHNPRHALAFAQLANTYLMLHEFASVPDGEAYTKAQEAASQALALDAHLPEAHASLGYIDFFSARNPDFAEGHFHEALRLDPGCALAHLWYGSLLTHQGRFQEAMEHLNRAQELQPTSSAIQASRAYALGLSGQREEAIRLLQSLLKTDPNAPAPHRTLARLSLMQPRNLELYLDETQKFAELRQNTAQQQWVAGSRQAFRRGGEQAMWNSILQRERTTQKLSGSPSYLMAQAEAQLGQAEPSLWDLEQLCTRRDSQVMNLAIDPLFEPLRRNPRFGALVAMVGLHAVAGAPGVTPAA